MADKKVPEIKDETIQDTETVAAIEEVYDPLKDLVTVKLHKSKENADDLFVSVNDYSYLIQRGVKVEVPRFIKEVIDNSELEDEKTLEKITKASEKAEKL